MVGKGWLSLNWLEWLEMTWKLMLMETEGKLLSKKYYTEYHSHVQSKIAAELA